MFDEPRTDLSGANPSDAAYDGRLGIYFAKRILVADAILDDDEGGLVVYDVLEERRCLVWVDSLVRADYVIELLDCI